MENSYCGKKNMLKYKRWMSKWKTADIVCYICVCGGEMR